MAMRRKRKRENLDSGCTSREREEALSDVPVSFAEVWRAGTLYDAAALVNGGQKRQRDSLNVSGSPDADRCVLRGRTVCLLWPVESDVRNTTD